MQTPDENPDGYNEAAVNNMEGFKHTKLFLMHGTADGTI
jgi:hypothetical protein